MIPNKIPSCNLVSGHGPRFQQHVLPSHTAQGGEAKATTARPHWLEAESTQGAPRKRLLLGRETQNPTILAVQTPAPATAQPWCQAFELQVRPCVVAEQTHAQVEGAAAEKFPGAP